jgi:photosynthetic reaction center cytochrome c subunit
VTSEPIVPTADSALAADELEGVPPALANVSVENYERLLEAMRSWTGIPDLLEPGNDSYQTEVAYSMIEMTQNINQNWAAHVQANAEVGVTCYTCHRGQAGAEQRLVPGRSRQLQRRWVARHPEPGDDDVELHLAALHLPGAFPAAGRGWLLRRRTGPRPCKPGGEPAEGDPLIQQAEMTYAWMNYIANSLGVNCVFCHNSRAFYDGAQVTPQWSTASLGIIMVQEQLELYILPLADVLPAERLGPIYADVPKLACRTCHQGEQQPLNGLNVIANWPELAVLDDVPDYSAFE